MACISHLPFVIYRRKYTTETKIRFVFASASSSFRSLIDSLCNIIFLPSVQSLWSSLPKLFYPQFTFWTLTLSIIKYRKVLITWRNYEMPLFRRLAHSLFRNFRGKNRPSFSALVPKISASSHNGKQSNWGKKHFEQLWILLRVKFFIMNVHDNVRERFCEQMTLIRNFTFHKQRQRLK